MGKPRLIILIRHAQSEGNKNKEIHQVIPDHRVKLTDEGRVQAQKAGHRLRDLLRPDDTLQFFISPYKRTRETTEGILKTLTSPGEDGTASPFSRRSITVYEEPRIREQDFGNFQPNSAEMARMWQERADYGHFFYRIPNGESAADAYDRIAGFNESLWRQFSEPDFPSVCVLVTHGLMTRVFLMKWYHWSVEYFEDLRNINHCEFIVMERNPADKYTLMNSLRTWSGLKQEQIKEAVEQKTAAECASMPEPLRRNTLTQFLPHRPVHEHPSSEDVVTEKGENHDQTPTKKKPFDGAIPLPAHSSFLQRDDSFNPNEHEDHGMLTPTPTKHSQEPNDSVCYNPADGADPTADQKRSQLPPAPSRRATAEDFERWAHESGMGAGRRADALGDEAEDIVEEVERDVENERAYEDSVRQSVY